MYINIVNFSVNQPEVKQRDKHHAWEMSCKPSHDPLKFASIWVIIKNLIRYKWLNIEEFWELIVQKESHVKSI